jgi:hypothetical protein
MAAWQRDAPFVQHSLRVHSLRPSTSADKLRTPERYRIVITTVGVHERPARPAAITLTLAPIADAALTGGR